MSQVRRIRKGVALLIPALALFFFLLHILGLAGSRASRVYDLLPRIVPEHHPSPPSPSWDCHVDITAHPARVLADNTELTQQIEAGSKVYLVRFIGDAEPASGLFAPTTVRESMHVIIWSVPGGPINDPAEMGVARAAAFMAAQDDEPIRRRFVTARLALLPIPPDGELRDEWVSPWPEGYRHNAVTAALAGLFILTTVWALRRPKPCASAEP